MDFVDKIIVESGGHDFILGLFPLQMGDTSVVLIQKFDCP